MVLAAEIGNILGAIYLKYHYGPCHESIYVASKALNVIFTNTLPAHASMEYFRWLFSLAWSHLTPYRMALSYQWSTLKVPLAIPCPSSIDTAFSISNYFVSATRTKPSAYSNSMGNPSLNSLDKASNTMINSNGPRTEPWCTPTLTLKALLSLPFTLIVVVASSYMAFITDTIHSWHVLPTSFLCTSHMPVHLPSPCKPNNSYSNTLEFYHP